MEAIVPQLVVFVLACAGMAPGLPELPTAAWEDLAAAPECHLDEPVLVYLQHGSAIERWEPFLTRFTPVRYAAYRAWTDDQVLWDEVDYAAPAARVFVDRRSRAARVLARLAPHERAAVVCVVRTAHLGRPWVEVLAVQRARHTVPEGSVLHAEKALDLMAREAWSMAREQLGRALAAPLPDRARAALEGLVALCDEAEEARVLGRTRRAAYRPADEDSADERPHGGERADGAPR